MRRKLIVPRTSSVVLAGARLWKCGAGVGKSGQLLVQLEAGLPPPPPTGTCRGCHATKLEEGKFPSKSQIFKFCRRRRGPVHPRRGSHLSHLSGRAGKPNTGYSYADLMMMVAPTNHASHDGRRCLQQVEKHSEMIPNYPR